MRREQVPGPGQDGEKPGSWYQDEDEGARQGTTRTVRRQAAHPAAPEGASARSSAYSTRRWSSSLTSYTRRPDQATCKGNSTMPAGVPLRSSGQDGRRCPYSPQRGGKASASVTDNYSPCSRRDYKTRRMPSPLIPYPRVLTVMTRVRRPGRPRYGH